MYCFVLQGKHPNTGSNKQQKGVEKPPIRAIEQPKLAIIANKKLTLKGVNVLLR